MPTDPIAATDLETPNRIDLTREIFADPIDGPEPIRLLSAADANAVSVESDRAAVALVSAPIRLTLGYSHDPATVTTGWSILGGTLESFPDRPATVSPAVDLNPSIKLIP